ncbi:MAG: phosphoribosyltransferase [Blastocatellia bacterium]|nr:phosphoribosyltransferase [Blastocatellia bacterium]
MRFRDRREAGRRLAARLVDYANRQDVIVLALTCGGVPVAYEVAEAIGAPLDVFLVRRLAAPGSEDLVIGAITTGGESVLNENVVRYLDISNETLEEVTCRERRELERREKLYRGGRPALDLFGRIIILVDDGLAAGSTMRAACVAIRGRRPARVIVAAPVAARATYELFNEVVDGVICARKTAPDPYYIVTLWYDDLFQTTDEEARNLLEQSKRRGIAS